MWSHKLRHGEAGALICMKPDVGRRLAFNAEGQARLTLFRRALGLGEDRNIRLAVCWGEDKCDLERKCAAELIVVAPDVILASGTESVMALQELCHTLPIVFATVGDPVGAGLVESLAHRGGNATGFMLYEYRFGGKVLELLKEIAPGAHGSLCSAIPPTLPRLPLSEPTGRSAGAWCGDGSYRHA
jgi:hypothetical protein